MKKLHAHILTHALATTLLVSAPAFASHSTQSTALGTPLHNGIPAFHQADVDRVIVIDDGDKYVNVEGGESIKFVIGEDSFEWLFDTYDTSPVFNLKEIAPAGLLGDQQIKVYVSPDPLYTS